MPKRIRSPSRIRSPAPPPLMPSPKAKLLELQRKSAPPLMPPLKANVPELRSKSAFAQKHASAPPPKVRPYFAATTMCSRLAVDADYADAHRQFKRFKDSCIADTEAVEATLSSSSSSSALDQVYAERLERAHKLYAEVAERDRQLDRIALEKAAERASQLETLQQSPDAEESPTCYQ